MKEDYLWDKTGDDPDVKMLEDALQVFRYKESAPPSLPAKVVTLQKKEPFYKGFRFALSAAACIAFGVLAFGAWFQVWRNNAVNQPVAEVSDKTEIKNTTINTPATLQNTPPQTTNVGTAQPTVKPPVREMIRTKLVVEKTPVRVQRAFYVTNKQKEIKAQQIKAVVPANVRLTKEELYAYNQLMLALSITSDKLKMVKDKVESSDEKSSGIETDR